MSALPTDAPNAASRHRWFALAILLVAIFAALIDATAATFALPSLAVWLGASDSVLTWVVAGFALGFGLGLVPAGRFSDRIGHKRAFILGTAIFALSAAVSVVSTNGIELVVARVIHGLGGALMFSAVYGSIQTLFADGAMVLAFAIFGAVANVAAAAGPIAAGIVLDAAGPEHGWQWALGLCLPLAVVSLIAAPRFIPTDVVRLRQRGFDYLGMVLVVGVVVGVLLPFIQTSGGSLPGWSAYSIGGAVVLAAAFVVWERRMERGGAVPLLPVSYFLHPSFSFGAAVGLVAYASFGGAIYVAVSLLWQLGRGATALTAALVVLPFSLGSALGCALGERFSARVGLRWAMTIALLMYLVGMLAVLFVLLWDPTAGLGVLLIPMLVAGIGSGLFVAPNLSSVLSTVSPRDAGTAGGLTLATQQVGVALGSALAIIAMSQPGTDGGFDPATMLRNGTLAIGVTAALGLAALLPSLVESLLRRKPGTLEADDAGLVADTRPGTVSG